MKTYITVAVYTRVPPVLNLHFTEVGGQFLGAAGLPLYPLSHSQTFLVVVCNGTICVRWVLSREWQHYVFI
jgi:hypothetical protein